MIIIILEMLYILLICFFSVSTNKSNYEQIYESFVNNIFAVNKKIQDTGKINIKNDKNKLNINLDIDKSTLMKSVDKVISHPIAIIILFMVFIYLLYKYIWWIIISIAGFIFVKKYHEP